MLNITKKTKKFKKTKSSRKQKVQFNVILHKNLKDQQLKMRSFISGVITLQGEIASLTGQRGTRARGFCAHQNGSYANMISVVSVLLKPLNLNDLLCFLGCSKVYWS